jgi:hypothetical protein
MAKNIKTGGSQWELREERMLENPSRTKERRNKKRWSKYQLLNYKQYLTPKIQGNQTVHNLNFRYCLGRDVDKRH